MSVNYNVTVTVNVGSDQAVYNKQILHSCDELGLLDVTSEELYDAILEDCKPLSFVPALA